MIAIIPAAGLGKRMAAITGGAPKELLRLGSRTVLERIVEEAREADVDEIVIVSSPQKPEIEAAVEDWRQGRFRRANLRVIYQTEPRGWADAVFLANAQTDVLVMLGDCVYRGGSPVSRMANLVYRGIDGCIAVEEVPAEEVHRYGICEINGMGGIDRIVEKPKLEETTSRWAGAARYAFTHRLLAHLEELYQVRASHDLPLTPLMNEAISNGFEFKAVALQPDQERVDCGTPEEYADALTRRWD